MVPFLSKYFKDKQYYADIKVIKALQDLGGTVYKILLKLYK